MNVVDADGKFVKGTTFSAKRVDELNTWLPLLKKYFGKHTATLTKLSQSQGVEGTLAKIVVAHQNGEVVDVKLADVAVPVKRGRGRPKGSLNKEGRKEVPPKPYGSQRGRPKNGSVPFAYLNPVPATTEVPADTDSTEA